MFIQQCPTRITTGQVQLQVQLQSTTQPKQLLFVFSIPLILCEEGQLHLLAFRDIVIFQAHSLKIVPKYSVNHY